MSISLAIMFDWKISGHQNKQLNWIRLSKLLESPIWVFAGRTLGDQNSEIHTVSEKLIRLCGCKELTSHALRLISSVLILRWIDTLSREATFSKFQNIFKIAFAVLLKRDVFLKISIYSLWEQIRSLLSKPLCRRGHVYRKANRKSQTLTLLT